MRPDREPRLAASDPAALLQPLSMRNAGERIAERLVTAIALGEFVPGQRLPAERELAVMLGVSRATVREAIQRLAGAGYVSVRRGRAGGAFVEAGWGPEAEEMVARVLQPEWDRLEHLFDFRHLVERQIARTAAERRRPSDVRAIRRALAQYERAGDDRESSRAADLALHLAIARATQNPYLEDLSLKIRNEISLGFQAEPYSPEVRRRALRQHPRLAAAVLDGQPARAAALAAEHFSLTEGMLRELMARVHVRTIAQGGGESEQQVPDDRPRVGARGTRTGRSARRA